MSALDKILPQQPLGDDGKRLAPSSTLSWRKVRCMSSGIWISTGFLPGWLLRRPASSPGAVRPPFPARLGAFAGLGAGCATASGVIGLGAGGTASSSKMPARADGFFAITQPRLLA
jgi:hypothetical protein